MRLVPSPSDRVAWLSLLLAILADRRVTDQHGHRPDARRARRSVASTSETSPSANSTSRSPRVSPMARSARTTSRFSRTDSLFRSRRFQFRTDGLEVVLLLDTSGSMNENNAIGSAKLAAVSFLDELPVEVPVGVVAFSDSPALVSPLTTDREALRGAIGQLHASGRTSLYDGIVFGNSLFSGATDDRQFVLLSDGGDTASLSTLEDALAITTDVRTNAIEIVTSESNTEALSQLASSGNGRLTSITDPTALGELYQEIARSLGRSLSHLVHLAIQRPDRLRPDRQLGFRAVEREHVRRPLPRWLPRRPPRPQPHLRRQPPRRRQPRQRRTPLPRRRSRKPTCPRRSRADRATRPFPWCWVVLPSGCLSPRCS